MRLFFKTEELKSRWEVLANEVLKQFSLPSSPSFVYFDDTDYKWLIEGLGSTYRGIATPVLGSGKWPDSVEDILFNECPMAYDFMIYLPGKTCTAEKPLFVITLAHEVQHFLQWSNEHTLWKAGSILFWNSHTLETLGKGRAWDIPTERQAMIVSKRVAESILGVERLTTFVDKKVREGVHKEEWLFFSELSSSLDYPLLDETVSLVNTYRPQLLKLQQSRAEAGEEPELDFSQTEWWK